MNAPLLSTPRVEPFFFDAAPGTRFCLYHAPNPQVAPRGAMLYVHPFTDELNRTRRMVAVQARAFAELGYAVLQLDLFACGDSCGESNAGRWEIWKEDLVLAARWLAERDSGPLTLWGLRLGGLLAIEASARLRPRRLLLWQPFLSGRACMDEFLRRAPALRQERTAARRGSTGLRTRLAAHGALEVAGYEVAVPLVQAIDACAAARLPAPPCPVEWLAYGGASPGRLVHEVAALARRWAQAGTTLRFQPLEGTPNWSGPGELDCPTLRAATCALFSGEPT